MIVVHTDALQECHAEVGQVVGASHVAVEAPPPPRTMVPGASR
jgi:hypothetical protein